MAFLRKNEARTYKNGYTLTELIVSLCISGVILALLFSLILASSRMAERSYIANDKEMCEKALLEPLVERMERARKVVLLDADERGRSSAALLFEKDRTTLVCTSDVSFEYNDIKYDAFCGENEVCLQSFLPDGVSAERIALKNVSERILVEDLEFCSVDTEKGVFKVRLLMSAGSEKFSSDEKYVCVFSM